MAQLAFHLKNLPDRSLQAQASNGKKYFFKFKLLIHHFHLINLKKLLH